MRQLTLIRHANAEWKDHGITDFDRPLTRKGEHEAEGLGKRLLALGVVPDLLLTSPALRARQTADILANTLGLTARRVKTAEPLYLARTETLLCTARCAGPRIAHLAVVGHNPGLSALARLLAPPEAAVPELATACACVLTFDTVGWEELSAPAAGATVHEPPAGLPDRLTVGA